MGLRELEERWDHLPAAEAVARAWQDPGPVRIHGTWHPRAVDEVRQLMPMLARGLDRLLAELEDRLPATDPALWEDVVPAGEECRCGHLRRRHMYGYNCRANRCGCARFEGTP